LKVELKKGKTFDTLYRTKQFDAYAYHNEILIIPESREIRNIREKDFRVIWKYGLTLSEKQKFHPTYYNNEMVQDRTVTASYTLTLIDFYLRKFNTTWE
jgi:hypothetical protein